MRKRPPDSDRPAGGQRARSNSYELGERSTPAYLTEAPDSLLEAALFYAGLGYRVVPLHNVRSGLCSCGEPVFDADDNLVHGSAGKHPRTRHGLKVATSDPDQITAWWREWPKANIGLLMDGLRVVLDVDPRNDGDATLKTLVRRHGPLPQTPRVESGGGGTHDYFEHLGEPIHTTKALGAGIDLIGSESLIVAPPSRHFSGERYRWAEGCPSKPARLPEWMAELAQAETTPKRRRAKVIDGNSKRKKGSARFDGDYRLEDLLEGVQEGQRDEVVYKYACSLQSRGNSRVEAKALISAAWDGLEEGSHPFSLEDAHKKVDEVWERYPGPKAIKASGKKAGVTSQLIDIATERCELFHDGDETFATIEIKDHSETHPLQESSFRKWLLHEYWHEHRAAPNPSALNEAIATLDGQARFDGPQRSVHLRMAEADGAIYVDMGDERWRAFKITAEKWCIVGRPKVRFRRPRGYKTLPLPVRGGTLEELRPFVNVEAEDFVLVLAVLVAALRPGVPSPIFAPNGEQGSAKSTLCRAMKALVDPGQVRRPPRNSEDLMVAVRNSYLLVFDNLSGIRDWLSDDLSAIATGTAYGTRKFYSNFEEALFEAKRPVIINGIGELGTREDLLDRIIPITLPPIKDAARETEDEFWRRFNVAAPRILGALFDAVTTALRRIDEIELDKHIRMADFLEWVVAAAPALGFSEDYVQEALVRAKQRTTDMALEASPIFRPLKGLINKRGAFEGNATALLSALERYCGTEGPPRNGWPSSPKVLGDQLRRLGPDLRRKGIQVEFVKNGRMWRITRRKARHPTRSRASNRTQ